MWGYIEISTLGCLIEKYPPMYCIMLLVPNELVNLLHLMMQSLYSCPVINTHTYTDIINRFAQLALDITL